MNQTAVQLLAAVALFCLSGTAPSSAPTSIAGSGRPNVLVILVDDLGVDQLRCYDPIPGGSLAPGENQYNAGTSIDPCSSAVVPAFPYAPTPNITRLAERGVRFLRAFTSATCSPSRAQFQTGRYPCRTDFGGVVTTDGVTNTAPNCNNQVDLNLDEVILPELLRLPPNGETPYELAFFGKWHLGRDPNDVSGVGSVASVLGGQVFPADVAGDDHPVLSGWPHYQGMIRNPTNRPNPEHDRIPPVHPSVCGPSVLDMVECEAGYQHWYDVTAIEVGGPEGPNVVSTRTATNPNLASDYNTTRQRKALEDWIVATEERSDRPWFAVWSTSAVHSPWTNWPPGGVTASCAPDPPGTLHHYGPSPIELTTDPACLTNPLTCGVTDIWTRFRAHLEALDSEIGILEDNLNDEFQEGYWDGIQVVFLGDNGTPVNVVKRVQQVISPGLFDPYGFESPQVSVCAQPPSIRPSRFKGSPYFTGTNIPLIFAGPAVDPSLAGTARFELVDMVDVFSTLLDITDVNPNSSPWRDLYPPGPLALDGRSFVKILEDDLATYRPRECSLAMHYRPNGPISQRHGLWVGYTKLFNVPEGRRLYRLIRSQAYDPLVCASTTNCCDELYLIHTEDMTGAITTMDILEINDLSGDPAHASILNEMRLELDQGTCTDGSGGMIELCPGMTCPAS